MSDAASGERLASIPVTDPALRLMVFSHLSRLRDGHGRRIVAREASCPIERIRSLSVAQLTRLVNTMHAPTIALRVNSAGASSCPAGTLDAALHDPLTYVICDNAADAQGRAEFIPADDPVLRVMLISHLIRQSYDKVLPDDTSIHEEISLDWLMRDIPSAACDRLTPGSPSQIEIRIDLARLNCDVNRYQHLSIDEAQFNYFIKAEASLSMMTELFKVSTAAVRKAQSQSGVRARAGRKCMPDEDACLCILAAWGLICQEMDSPRDRFESLHQQFGQFTMAQLYTVVNTSRRRP